MEATEYQKPDLADVVFHGDPPTDEQKIFHLTRLSTELVERMRLEPLDERWGAALMGAWLNLSKYLTHIKEVGK
jgi:hypothetical protein